MKLLILLKKSLLLKFKLNTFIININIFIIKKKKLETKV